MANGAANGTIAQAVTITRSQDFKAALERAIKANKPFVLDVRVDAAIRPPSTRTWQLPRTPYKEPIFGRRRAPDAAAVK
jgi:acetolactate synthase I/II/III large subunit